MGGGQISGGYLLWTGGPGSYAKTSRFYKGKTHVSCVAGVAHPRLGQRAAVRLPLTTIGEGGWSDPWRPQARGPVPLSVTGFFSENQSFQREKSDQVLAADRTRRKRLLHPILADRRKRPGQLQ